MRQIRNDNPDPPTVCYIPHHAVIKEFSTTTKVRSVFDASAKTSTGYSLNDCLLVGPVIQDDLLNIILRFRKCKIVMIADIEKIYRQIKIHPDDRPLQRVLWRFNKGDPITKCEMTTVTYGLASSSFLATRTLHQLANDEGAHFSLAAHALKEDFYMDDFVRGEDNIETALQLRKEMDELLSRGGFPRRGKPNDIDSDNATNFVGAKNELNALYRMLSSTTEVDRIATNLAVDGIQWHMIPPRAPNFGGLWEAAVKVAKNT
ncbi:uncharacterized protein LOC131434046 [Malaya genurostris]|uniref:uncharacterized protein LOC131434046 n=1 Tax=Malaya genurostris TaxID=325434 RepID=UPI0026F3965D|nr:uncharacterized protein LOC131434046 [Malaya genurostris]